MDRCKILLINHKKGESDNMSIFYQEGCINKALTNISIAYSNEKYITDQIFKKLIIKKQSDKYCVYGIERFIQHDDRRVPGTEANEINWIFSEDSYDSMCHVFRVEITDEEVQNVDDIFVLEAAATELMTEKILFSKEIDAANKLLDANKCHKDLRVTLGSPGTSAKWSDYKNSNPILDIKKAREAIYRKSGLRPNVLIISELVKNVLELHPKLHEFGRYVQKDIISIDLMADAFGVDKVLVGSATNANNPEQIESRQNEPLNYIWGNSAILAYVPSRPGKYTPATAYSFMWDKGGEGPVQVRSWYETGRRATMVEVSMWYDQKIVCNTTRFIFVNAVDLL